MISGYFDKVAGRDVCGWLWDSDKPTQPVTASVFVNGQLVAQGPANQYRPDLHSAGIGDGRHAFNILLPDDWTQGQIVTLEVRGPDGKPIHRTPLQARLPQLRFQPIAPIDGAMPIELAICAIVRDEADYLLEWIAWHRLVGVSRFVLLDDASTDRTGLLLAALSRQGVVDHVPWPDIDGMAAQRPAYIAGLARLGPRCRWVAFVDADEFLTPLQGETVPQIMASFATAGGLVVPWRLFGSSGLTQRTPGLVIERFTQRAPEDHPLNRSVKTIVQPRLVFQPDIHTPHLLAGNLIDEFGRVAGGLGHPDRHPVPNARRLVISHFFTKSREEWDHKRRRGQATEVRGTQRWLRPDHHFKAHDLNQVRDATLCTRAPEVNAEMERLKALIGLE